MKPAQNPAGPVYEQQTRAQYFEDARRFLPLTVNTAGNVTEFLHICMVNRQNTTKDHE